MRRYTAGEAFRKDCERADCQSTKSCQAPTFCKLGISAEDATLVRTFSRAGPCITEGRLVKTTAKFYVYDEWQGATNYLGKRRISCDKAHITPCISCKDHPNSQFKDGYMD